MRMSPEEFKAIQAMAASSGLSMNAFIVARCLDAPAKPDKAKAQGQKSTASKAELPAWSGGYGKAISSK